MNESARPKPRLNRDYVLAPFQQLLSNCQSNVLMGLRLVENLGQFPSPTPEELQLFYLSFQTNDRRRSRQCRAKQGALQPIDTGQRFRGHSLLPQSDVGTLICAEDGRGRAGATP